jgi:CheY-like chemotaxis protein
VIKGFAECLLSPDAKEVSFHANHCTGGGDAAGLDSTTALRRISARIGNNQLVQHILDSCTHIQRILDNSLDLGKLEQHKLVLEDEVVDIKAIGDQVGSMMSKRLQPGVQFLVQCPDVSFRGDNTRWLQLLLNLVSSGHNTTHAQQPRNSLAQLLQVSNAMKFTSAGVVRLEVLIADEISPGDRRWTAEQESNNQRALLVQVTDTGCGISKEGQAALFQKYQQVHGSGQPQGPPAKVTAGASAHAGTGLGLVISQHIVHLMGCPTGISVQSPWQCHEGTGSASRGAGTMFSFSVVPKDLTFNQQAAESPPSPSGRQSPTPSHTPVPQVSPSSSRQSPPPVPPIGRHIKASIMVVDDELLNRMVLLSKLRQCEEGVRERLEARRGMLGGDACQFSMEVVQAEHAEMALVVMHDKIEVRQKQALTDVVHVDIIILDEHMESSGGILKGTEAMTHFRQLAQKHDEKQPVIVLSSGNCSQADQQRYTAMGADDTWRKPYPTGDLVVESLVEWVVRDQLVVLSPNLKGQ